MASMFSDAGPDFRWVGNERGIAGDPCWAMLNLNRPDRHPCGTSEGLTTGERPGTHWIPAECDVSIRPGWFYHAAEDAKVKTADQLLDIYYQSVGRGACLNLNLPPDRRGRIHENDVAALQAFQKRLYSTFANNLTKNARISASQVRGAAPDFSPAHLIDAKRDTFWATDDQVTTAEVILDLPRAESFNVISLREPIALGQRIERFALDQWQEGQWKEIAQGTSIGSRRLVRLPAKVTSERVRLRIVQASASPALSDLSLHAEP